MPTEYDLQGSMMSPANSPRMRGGGQAASPERNPVATVLLSYSGGLVGTVLLRYLVLQGKRVSVVISNLGQECDFDEIEQTATEMGAEKVYVEDIRGVFLEDFVIPSLQANAAYEGRDLLGTALSRFAIAKRQCEIAFKEGLTHVAHGCSGIGNDQCRFELTYAALYPQLKIEAPFRDPEFCKITQSRTTMIAWLTANTQTPLASSLTNTTTTEYSTDKNLYTSSMWGGALGDPNTRAPDSVWGSATDPARGAEVKPHPPPDHVVIEFKDGAPCSVTNQATDETATDVIGMFTILGKLGHKHRIGRQDIVDNKFIGVKCRRVLECPAGEILLQAHQDIEGVAMDREVRYMRDMFTPKFAELAYNGFWFSPEMDFIQAAVKKSQEIIDGTVTLQLYRGTATPVSRASPTTVPGCPASADPMDVDGYIKVQALRLKAHATIMDLHSCASQAPNKTTSWKQAEGQTSSYKKFWHAP